MILVCSLFTCSCKCWVYKWKCEFYNWKCEIYKWKCEIYTSKCWIIKCNCWICACKCWVYKCKCWTYKFYWTDVWFKISSDHPLLKLTAVAWTGEWQNKKWWKNVATSQPKKQPTENFSPTKSFFVQLMNTFKWFNLILTETVGTA